MNRYAALFDLEEISRNWGWFLLLGVFLILLGGIAVGGMWMATLASVVVFGTLLVTGGLFEILVAFGVRHSKGLLLRVLTGVLSVAVGSVLIRNPGASVASLTMLLAWLFLVAGLLRTITALTLRYPAWEWTTLESTSALILGLLVWISGPLVSLWVIAMFTGIGLIFRGLAWVMFAWGARHVRRVAFA